MTEVLQCRERSTKMCWAVFIPLESLPVPSRAVPAPYNDGATHDALNCAPVEVRQNLGWHANLPQSSQEIQSLLCLLDVLVCVVRPGEIFSDVYSEELKGLHALHLSLTCA